MLSLWFKIHMPCFIYLNKGHPKKVSRPVSPAKNVIQLWKHYLISTKWPQSWPLTLKFQIIIYTIALHTSINPEDESCSFQQISAYYKKQDCPCGQCLVRIISFCLNRAKSVVIHSNSAKGPTINWNKRPMAKFNATGLHRNTAHHAKCN
jgi:hypothetical protein